VPELRSNANFDVEAGTRDFGLEAETFPLYACGATGTILTTAGAVFGTAMYVRRRTTISQLVANLTVAGATLTASNCWGMLFDSDGDLRGQTADQSTLWATAGVQSMALSAHSGSAKGLTLDPGLYWGAVVATGTTLPTFSRAAMGSASVALAAAAYNMGVGAAQSRCGVLATSITTTPADIVPGSITQATGIPIWFGVR
jgi:hypothetical protein